MTGYRATQQIPPLVKRAINLARQMERPSHCSFETGRLLQLLTSQHQSGVIGDVTTGCGTAAAWMVSALSAGVSLFTVESDSVSAAAARALFNTMLNVRVIQGDWRDFLRTWRFCLLYAGPESPREEDPEIFLRALRTGGMIILSGLTPENQIPIEYRQEPDPIREFWLNDSRLLASEIQVSDHESVILATYWP